MTRSMAVGLLRAALVAGAAVTLLGPSRTSACDQAKVEQEQATATAAPAPSPAGMRTYSDPATGEILDRAPAGAVPLPSPRSAPAVRESAGTSSGGGVKLEGDFRMGMRTHTDADGKTTTDCIRAGQE